MLWRRACSGVGSPTKRARNHEGSVTTPIADGSVAPVDLQPFETKGKQNVPRGTCQAAVVGPGWPERPSSETDP